MSDDLTVMGIAATAAAAMGREQIVLAHQAEHPLAGNPDVATDPKPSPDLAVALALPGRCLQVGFDRHQQRLVRRSRASVPDALPAAARRAGRRSWRRTRSGPCPRRRRPAAGRRPDPCRARWRHSSPRPPPPQRAEGLRLGLQQFHLHGQLSDPLHGAIQFRLHRIALALLERGGRSRRSLSHATARAGRSLRPTGATEVAPARHAKAATENDLTLARHRPSLAKSQRACWRFKSLAWGKRGRAKHRARFTGTGSYKINSNFLGSRRLWLSGHVPVLRLDDSCD